MAVQRRVEGLGMVDNTTARHSLTSPARTSLAAPSCVLSARTQQSFYEMLHGPLTLLQHQTALRRHAACGRCTLNDVFRVSDLGQRIFFMVPLRWRGPFARTCHEWNDIARLCWQVDEFELVDLISHVPLKHMGEPVAQLSSWVRANQSKPIFFLLALSEEGRLEQLRVLCKKPESLGWRRQEAEDVKVEHCKDWRLEEAVPQDKLVGGVPAQFVVTKHHAYCVVTVRGQALLVKLGGQINGTHEQQYTSRFPKNVTTMSMCALDNNIIAFGVPLHEPRDGSAGGGGLEAAAVARDCLSDTRDAARGGTPNVIEMVNFAQAAAIQTLHTSHRMPMLELEYSPDSEQLLSCSGDCVHVWRKETLELKGPGAMEETPESTLILPVGTTLTTAKVHPAWASVLLATNEALEVRELRRAASELLEARERGLSLKWRRGNMQISAAAFIAQGNMIVVSDRGDRLLFLNYHGLHAAKRCLLPWGSIPDPFPSRSSRERGVVTVSAITECPDVAKGNQEWCSGVSHLAVSSSRGEVALLKI